MTRHLIGTAAALLLASAGVANAGQIVFSPGDFTTGTSSASLDGATVTSSPRPFEVKDFQGVQGLGVQGGFVGGEIDLQNSEQIVFTFDNPTQVTDIQLAFLYQNGNFGDVISELARFVITVVAQQGWLGADLSVTGTTTATFGYSGDLAALVGTPAPTAVNLSAANESGAGLWEIVNPFGDLLISSITFQALLNNTVGASSANSDYSIVRLAGEVPEPVTIGLLVLGLAALGLRGRRRRPA